MLFFYFNYHVLATLSFFSTVVLAANIQVRSQYAIKEIHNAPRKWSRVGRAPADHMINLQIGLKQSRFKELERHLWEVSDPNNRRYGQHLSEGDVRNLVKPTDECLMHVHAWLLDHGITGDRLKYSPARDWIGVTLSISTVERLLDTEYSVFQNSEDGSYLVRAPQWSLPRHLHGHVEAIQPTNSFFRPQPKRKQSLKVATTTTESIMGKVAATEIDPALAAACNGTTMTPNCLRTLYGTINYTPKSLDKNQIGLTNYIGEVNNRSDVTLFLQTLRPDAVAGATEFKTVLVDGGEDVQTLLSPADITAGRGKEGNLDAETVLGISYPTRLTAWTTGGVAPNFTADLRTPTNSNEPYLAWLNFVINQTDLPQVISTSYADDEQTIPLSYATAVCNGFAQLGARGITLLFSSGDEGVGANGACVSNDGRNASTFLPVFPASCPYVTAVGGTRNVAPEIVALDELNGFVSGGGFSSYFARPAYQEGVVPQYVSSLGNQFAGQFNASGRGYPDIAAQGFRYAVAYNGAFINLDGTSASAPTAASVMALVNDALIAAGKPVMGFMNPWLYAQGNKAFTDVTNGSAIGCNTTGFPAAAGWDAVTGFGTPSFQKIQTAVLANATAQRV